MPTYEQLTKEGIIDYSDRHIYRVRNKYGKIELQRNVGRWVNVDFGAVSTTVLRGLMGHMLLMIQDARSELKAIYDGRDLADEENEGESEMEMKFNVVATLKSSDACYRLVRLPPPATRLHIEKLEHDLLGEDSWREINFQNGPANLELLTGILAAFSEGGVELHGALK